MAVRYPITLNVSEPNNNIGLLKIRQADEETQTLVVQILEDAIPKSYEGLEVFFCAKLGQTDGLGIIEQKLTTEEMTNPKSGKLEYTFRSQDWQILGRQNAYFSFRKMIDEHKYVQQFSTRDFTYEVTKNIFSDGSKQIISDGSTYVWTIEDLKRLFEEYIASGKTDWENFVDSNKEILESIDPGGTILTQLGDIKTLINNQSVNVALFGAIGDGETDDSQALKKCHDYANENGFKVIYEKGKTYLLSNSIEITVKTDIDFNGATILIDDTKGSQVHAYHLVNDKETVVLSESSLSEMEEINTGKVEALEKYGKSFVYVEDATTKTYIRQGTNADDGIPQAEGFIVSDQGEIVGELITNYDQVTYSEIRSFNQKRITIENGIFISTGFVTGEDLNQSYKRDIFIERNQVTLKNCVHKIDSDSTNRLASQGFFYHYRCADQIVEDVIVQPRIYTVVDGTPRGTYEFGNYDVVNIDYIRCDGYSINPELWGCFGGNRMKNAKFSSCRLNRIDSHIGSQDVVISDSYIGDKGLTLIGSGTLIVENTVISSFTILNFRSDYGASWNGDIVVRNCILDTQKYNNQEGKFSLAVITAVVNHNYGYDLHFGDKSIIFENINVLEKEDRQDKFVVINYRLSESPSESSGVIPHTIADQITIKNVNRQHGRAVKIFSPTGFEYVCAKKPATFTLIDTLYSGNFNIVPNVLINVSDTLLWKKYDTCSTTISSGSFFDGNFKGAKGTENIIIDNTYGNGMIPHFVVRDCTEMNATVEGYACLVTVENTTISGMYCVGEGSRSLCKFTNCNFVPRPKSSNPGKIIRSSEHAFFFTNCIFKEPYIFEDGIDKVVKNDIKTIYDTLFGSAVTTPAKYLIPAGAFVNCKISDAFDVSTIYDKVRFTNLFGGYARYVAHLTKGTKENRPEKANMGDIFYDETDKKIVFWNGSDWQ